jgi:hypothetical protein
MKILYSISNRRDLCTLAPLIVEPKKRKFRLTLDLGV